MMLDICIGTVINEKRITNTIIARACAMVGSWGGGIVGWWDGGIVGRRRRGSNGNRSSCLPTPPPPREWLHRPGPRHPSSSHLVRDRSDITIANGRDGDHDEVEGVVPLPSRG